MSIFQRIVAGAIVVALLGSTASAQERLEIFTLVDGQVRLVELDATASSFGRIVSVQRLPQGAYPNPTFGYSAVDPVAVAGGRYLVWAAGSGTTLVAFDRPTRQLIDPSPVLPLDWYGLPVSGVHLLPVDPVRPRLFFSSKFGYGIPQRYALWALDLETLTSVQLSAQTRQVTTATYAPMSDELFYWDMASSEASDTRSIVTVDASTGEERRRWLIAQGPGRLHADPAGRYLWLDRRGGLERVDAVTGATLARSDQFSAAFVTPDLRRALLQVQQGDFLVGVDPLQLTEVGRVRIAFSPPLPDRAHTLQSVPGRATTAAYTVRTESYTRLLSYGRTGRDDTVEVTCGTLALDVLALNGTRRATVSVLEALSPQGQVGGREAVPQCSAIAVPVMAPFAPEALTAVVSGSAVTLSWSDAGDATGFEVEFGFAPGQRAGALRVGRTTSLVLPGVPPGSHYVRVKAMNEVGTSGASNEIRVDVR